MSGDQTLDTIVAIATPPGRGALAIVRVSGPAALAIGARLVSPWPDAPRRATLARVRDRDDAAVDEAVVVTYRAPASFTGEDAVEITCHGGALTSATIAAAFVAEGARPAEPGEFTRRAVLNGKLDLLQAEAIADLVDASSRPAQRVALSQLDGGLSRRIAALRDRILDLEALAAYDIDFPDEDDGPIPPARVLSAADAAIADLDALIATAPLGEIVRAGAVVVIAGPPNVGKSSLFNALLGRRRAIVTELPGTTRDALEAVTEAEGWPIRLIDTAGMRDTDERVEQLGIEVSRQYVRDASVVLACGDDATSLGTARQALSAITRAPLIGVWTKSDLTRPAATNGDVAVSAETGAGLGHLAGAIARCLQASAGALQVDAPLLTRERQRVAVTRARDELRRFRDAFAGKSLPVAVAAVHLRDATRELEELIGFVDVEDVLDRVFRSFCVGK